MFAQAAVAIEVEDTLARFQHFSQDGSMNYEIFTTACSHSNANRRNLFYLHLNETSFFFSFIRMNAKRKTDIVFFLLQP